MAEVFQRSRVLQAWLAGARYLSEQKNQEARNIILEINTPQLITAEDLAAINDVNSALQKIKPTLSVMTAASTIFPQRVYQHYRRPGWYKKYKQIIQKGKVPGSWGTYAMRMIERKGDGDTLFNPLDSIIEKLASMRERHNPVKSTYELGISDLSEDIGHTLNGEGFELPTYDPHIDRKKQMGSPCLSHVTFKLIDGKIDLTAIYRSHYYAERALGNLIGLSQLQDYVANESGFELGVLTCVSTYAKLDKGFGGILAARKLLKTLPNDESFT